ncbi:hypothetical protein C3K47_16095 [Solitalea longa]|uniref:Copper resistance protein NlpE n=1 Tax=Solitalea longa TaxID=2079460 RepID=A0A2S4ZY76_9SPHI|nr:copper resistance protein NlpE [Solitalea longa]POY35304.1 hypothetical protein C3K47_16095 [Solitalea longa]
MNKYFFIIPIVVLLVGCQSNQKEKAAEKAADSIAASTDSLDFDSTDAADAKPVKRLAAAYHGTLPCADCGGITTELSLYEDNTYELSEVYQGKGDGKPFLSRGNYTTDKGFENDDKAVLYVLDYDRQGHERYFLKSNSELIMLDRTGKRIKSVHNYTLVKK